METTQDPPLIFARMAAILRDTKAIGKDRTNTQQGFKFRGIDDVYASLHSVFSEHGVFIATEVIDDTATERTTARGNALYHHVVKVRFTFYAEDGSSVSAVGLGEAMDSGDKAINKCLSIALKYVLFQAFLIPTEDAKDPDAETPEQTLPRSKPVANARPARQAAQAPAGPIEGNAADWESTPIKFGSLKGKTIGQVALEEPEELPGMLQWCEDKYDPNGQYAQSNANFIAALRAAIEASAVGSVASDGNDETDNVPY